MTLSIHCRCDWGVGGKWEQGVCESDATCMCVCVCSTIGLIVYVKVSFAETKWPLGSVVCGLCPWAVLCVDCEISTCVTVDLSAYFTLQAQLGQVQTTAVSCDN